MSNTIKGSLPWQPNKGSLPLCIYQKQWKGVKHYPQNQGQSKGANHYAYIKNNQRELTNIKHIQRELTWSWRLFRAAWTAEKVASANAGDLDLSSGDLDLARRPGDLARAIGEVDRARENDTSFSGVKSSSASFSTDSAMLRRALWRDSVSSLIWRVMSVSWKTHHIGSLCNVLYRETPLNRTFSIYRPPL